MIMYLKQAGNTTTASVCIFDPENMCKAKCLYVAEDGSCVQTFKTHLS